MVLMYSSAKIEVRRKKFEIFWYIHNIGYLVFFICLFLHACGCFVSQRDPTDPKIKVKCYPYNSWAWAMPGFALYFIERCIREARARQKTTLTKVIFHPGNTMEIQFEKPGFDYRSGQYLFINIPEVSYWQWHPFTITSTPEEGFVSLHICLLGDWTNKAAEVLGCFKDGINKSNMSKLPTLRIDGPFGAPAEDLYKYKVACLIGAGIGITPAAALLKSVWYKHFHNTPMELRKIYFFWINRDKDAFEWFQSLLATIEESVPRAFLEIHVYLTGKMSVDDIQNIVLNSSDTLDPLTELKSHTHYGRPEWERIFNAIKLSNSSIVSSNGGKLDVGVFFCGPVPLAHTIGDCCKKSSTDIVKFTLRKEKF